MTRGMTTYHHQNVNRDVEQRRGRQPTSEAQRCPRNVDLPNRAHDSRRHECMAPQFAASQLVLWLLDTMAVLLPY